jgi:hypothetical protein
MPFAAPLASPWQRFLHVGDSLQQITIYGNMAYKLLSITGLLPFK